MNLLPSEVSLQMRFDAFCKKVTPCAASFKFPVWLIPKYCFISELLPHLITNIVSNFA